VIIALDANKDYLAARISYKLDLKGPRVIVQTGCSTSLVAVHFACQSLLANECDTALAGGVSTCWIIRDKRTIKNGLPDTRTPGHIDISHGVRIFRLRTLRQFKGSEYASIALHH
jgi:acetyl-CoA acetyltransferase